MNIQTVQELIDVLNDLPNKSEYVGIYEDYVLHKLDIEVSPSGAVSVIRSTTYDFITYPKFKTAG